MKPMPGLAKSALLALLAALSTSASADMCTPVQRVCAVKVIPVVPAKGRDCKIKVAPSVDVRRMEMDTLAWTILANQPERFRFGPGLGVVFEGGAAAFPADGRQDGASPIRQHIADAAKDKGYKTRLHLEWKDDQGRWKACAEKPGPVVTNRG